MCTVASHQVLEDVGLVVAAGGAGRRFASGRNKLLKEIRGQALFTHCLARFLPHFSLPHIILVLPHGENAAFRKALRQAGLPTELRCVAGGRSRCESVERGLAALPASAEIVAIHDAARPATSVDILKRCILSARERGSGVAAHRVTDTIKIAHPDRSVESTPERQSLWAAETPQVFRMPDILNACRKALADNVQITDDAQALERLGKPVFLVENASPNPKITFAHDIPHEHHPLSATLS